MPSLMFGFLTFMIFMIAGFGIGFLAALSYWLWRRKPVRKHQFGGTADRQATRSRRASPDASIRTGVDGGTALSGFTKR